MNNKPKYIQRKDKAIDLKNDSSFAILFIKDLLSSQLFGVLSTVTSNQPYNSLIAFAFDENLKYIYFATPKKTRKYKTILGNNHVSLLIDNRSNQLENINEINVATVTGAAEVLETDEKIKAIATLKDKHPNLDEFLNSETTGILRIDVEQYYCISNFQEVFEWKP